MRRKENVLSHPFKDLKSQTIFLRLPDFFFHTHYRPGRPRGV
jgi:hypothetical protein